MHMSLVDRIKRLAPALGAFIFGDRLLLRSGRYAALARILGMPPSLYRPHPYTLYELNPGWVSPDGRARHNSLGYRGAEVATEKRAGCLRVVCMGESTTYCTGIKDDRATYPARLEAHLRALMPGRDIEVVNAGVGGYTSIENLLHCHFRIAPLSPDLVVYYYTHNDVHPRRMPHLSRDYREYSRSWFEPPFGGGLSGWIGRRRALALGDIGHIVRRYDEYCDRRNSANVAKNPPQAFRANMTALALIAQEAGARVLFVNPPYRDLHKFEAGVEGGNPVNRAVFEHRKIIEEIGRELGLAVYDLARNMPFPDDPNAFPTEYYLDSVHVNECGADRMGKLIADVIVAEKLMPED